MKCCSISWCVALTDKQFCAAHEQDQGLHPAELDEEDDDFVEDDEDYTDDGDDDDD